MYKEIAIIAPTASGKTDLSLELAHKTNSIILSLDSLSVYKEIDIASAKPSKEERGEIVHFGIDEIYPNEDFDVMEFIACYKRAKAFAQKKGKNLIIVGGTGFYLKALINGISPIPKVSGTTLLKVDETLEDLEESYNLLSSLDPLHMEKIERNDRYRMAKALEIYYETGISPSEYFKQNAPTPIIKDLALFEIETEVELLRKRISLRTKMMLEQGIIEEVEYLEKKYSREPNCMKSIGIKEVLEYLDGKLDMKELEYWISTHTAQLAKRQRTFNRGQFKKKTKGKLEILKQEISKVFS